MPTAPDHSDEQTPVAADGATRLEMEAVSVFKPLGAAEQGLFGSLRDSPTNRWRVRQD
jgi:hypothetical protein